MCTCYWEAVQFWIFILWYLKLYFCSTFWPITTAHYTILYYTVLYMYYTILCLPNIAMASFCYLFPSVSESSSVVGSTKLSSSLKTCREINRENDTTNRPCSHNRSLRKINTKPKLYITQRYSMYTQMCMYSILASRVDALVMRQLKIDWFKMIALKLQAVSHNTSHPIITDSTLHVLHKECLLAVTSCVISVLERLLSSS